MLSYEFCRVLTNIAMNSGPEDAVSLNESEVYVMVLLAVCSEHCCLPRACPPRKAASCPQRPWTSTASTVMACQCTAVRLGACCPMQMGLKKNQNMMAGRAAGTSDRIQMHHLLRLFARPFGDDGPAAAPAGRRTQVCQSASLYEGAPCSTQLRAFESTSLLQ
jgi:hypothetical protein